MALRKNILNFFDINGYCLRNDAVLYLLSFLEKIPTSDHHNWLERIIELLQKEPLVSSVIDEQTVKHCLQECSTTETNDETFQLILSFDIPRFDYNQERKKFFQCPAGNLHSDPDAKANLFRQQFLLIQQRVMRHRLFSKSTVAALKGETFLLKPVEYLLSSSGPQENVIVLGMITQLKHGIYYLEDPTGNIQMDLTETTYKSGLFTENSFVLVEGSCQDGILKANAVGFPPPETAETSIENLGNLNFFGGVGITNNRNSEKLRFLEERNQDALIVFVSDVWLDQTKIIDKLNLLFAGFSESPPTAFVFFGNFVSDHKGKSLSKVMKDCFRKLAGMILAHPHLAKKSKFVFVPGPNDSGLKTILPRPPLPSSLTKEFESLVGEGALFASNPCRVQFCTQEIVLFREDLISKVCRNTINSPWLQQKEEIDLPQLLAKSLVANAHLCPLPSVVSPTYVNFDQSLRLYPLPDLVVCADKYKPYQVSYNKCLFINPGSFPKTDFSFKVYIPATKSAEESQIADDDVS